MRDRPSGSGVPSLVRFLVFCLVIAVLVGVAMYILANYVEPSPSETTIRIPVDRIQPR
jgi:hypothetical protein